MFIIFGIYPKGPMSSQIQQSVSTDPKNKNDRKFGCLFHINLALENMLFGTGAILIFVRSGMQ